MGNSVRAQRAIAELRQQAISRRQEYRKEVEKQIGLLLPTKEQSENMAPEVAAQVAAAKGA